MNPRQLCNAMYAHMVAGADKDQRTELRNELLAPLDPWEQAEKVFADLDRRR